MARARKKCRESVSQAKFVFVFLLYNKIEHSSVVYCSLFTSSLFLRALQQNRAQTRLLYLFYNKESIKFPTYYFQFSKQSLFAERKQSHQHALFSHRTRYNKPIRIRVRMVQIMLNKTKAVKSVKPSKFTICNSLQTK